MRSYVYRYNTNSFIVLTELSRLYTCLQPSESCEHFFWLSAAGPRGTDHPLHMPPHSRLSRKVLAYTSASTLAVAGGGYYFLNSGPAYPTSTRESRRPQPPWLPPGREQNIDVLKASGSGDDHAKLDLLVVGGGATGAGVAVDAASRGLKVAVVERDDFSSGMVASTIHSYFKSCLTVRCHLRDILEIDKARPWRRPLLTEGGDGARL
jgi:hypothetical protein